MISFLLVLGIILTIGLMVYIPFYFCVVGGIIQFINGIVPTIVASNIAWGIVKVFILSSLSFYLLFILLAALLVILKEVTK